MSEKKIAESINVRINVGNYQHIDITKYAETTISYENDVEMVKKEDELTQQLLDNIIRNMRTIPERLGKKTDAVDVFENSVSKTIPEWLENGPIPNIMPNGAKVESQKVEAEVNAEIEAKKTEEKELEALTEGDGTSDSDIFETSIEGETGESTSNDMSEIIPEDGSTKQPEDPKEENNIEDVFSDDDDLFR